MKRNLIRVAALLLVAIMLAVCTSCKQVINVKFVDSEGNELDLASLAGSAGGGSYTPVEADLTPTIAQTVTNAPVTNVAPAANDTTASAAKATAAPATSATSAPAAKDTTAPAAAASNSGMPQTKDQILAFYKSAVAKVKGGAAGYDKKAWQKVPDLKLFDSDAANTIFLNLAGAFVQTEDKATVEHNEKGSEDAVRRMPECTLTDMSKIKEATCTMDGSNYSIKIVLVDETAPATKDASFLNQITDNFLAKDSIQNELDNNSLLKVLHNVTFDMVYHDYTISATITPEGQFVNMLHHSSVQVTIKSGTLDVLVTQVPLENKSAKLDADCSFTNFAY